MNDFVTAYNKNLTSETEEGILEKPFKGSPDNLSQPEIEELKYRFMYLHESVEDLAFLYRLTPQALQNFITREELIMISLSNDDDYAEFESTVTAKYKQNRIKLSGLVTLHTAKSWSQLALAEENLLASLVQATEQARKQVFPDAKTLASLANTHNKLIDRHALIKNAIDVPAVKDAKGIVDALTKSLEDVLDRIDGSSYKLPSEDNSE